MKKENTFVKSSLIVTCCFSFLVSCNSPQNSSIVLSELSSTDSSEESTSVEKKVSTIIKEDLVGDYVKWIGRTELVDDQVYFYYTATGFEVGFYGTYLETTFYSESGLDSARRPYYSIFLDGQDLLDSKTICLEQVDQTIKLVEGLENSYHTLKLLKRSEPYDGKTAISKIQTDGYFKKYEETKHLKFQILGASGISGHGSLGQPNTQRTTKNSSSLHAFGYLTSRMFEAETQFVSNSGFGLVWGNNNCNLATAYDLVGVDKNVKPIDREWDHTKFVPDVVIVNIGGNDFTSYVNNLADPSEAKKTFRMAVISFLTHIHSLYPSTYVIWTHTNSSNGTEAASAISDYSKRKQVKVVVMPKVGSDGDPEGANGHNSIYTHIRAASIIASSIETLSGLKHTKENITWEE